MMIATLISHVPFRNTNRGILVFLTSLMITAISAKENFFGITKLQQRIEKPKLATR
jgi:hypothetical protein